MRLKITLVLTLLFLYSCACNYVVLDSIVNIKTPFEKMIAEQEYERLKKEARPVVITLEDPPAEEPIRLPANTTNEARMKYILGGESDKDEAGGLKSLFFEFNQTSLSRVQKDNLKNNALEISKNPQITLLISAHTDIIGNNKYNKKLSLKRAKNVFNHLLAEGIDRKRLSIHVAGTDNPLTEIEFKPIETPEQLEYYKQALSRNRRVNFIIDSLDGKRADLHSLLATTEHKPKIKHSTSAQGADESLDPTVPQSVFFNFNSKEFSSNEATKLEQITEDFKKLSNKKLLVSVHVKGTSKEKVRSNLQLVTERASFLYAYLLSKGLSPNQFSIKISKIDAQRKIKHNPNIYRTVSFTNEDSLSIASHISSQVITQNLPAETLVLKPASFVSKSSKLSPGELSTIEDNLSKIASSPSLFFTAHIYIKGSSQKIIDINRRLALKRMKVLNDLIKSKNLNNKISIALHTPDTIKTNENYFNNNYRRINFSMKPIEINSTPPVEITERSELLAEAKIDEIKPIIFKSKSSFIPADQKELLMALFEQLVNKPNARISASLYIKGSSSKSIRINRRLAEARKRALKAIIEARGLAKQFEVNIFTPDIDKVFKGQFHQNYRQVDFSSIDLQNRNISSETTEGVKDDFNFHLIDTFYFRKGQTLLNNKFKKSISQALLQIQLNETSFFHVISYIDRHGQRNYNQNLARKRIINVIRHLKQLGVSKNNIKITIKTNTKDPSEFLKNKNYYRRVEILKSN